MSTSNLTIAASPAGTWMSNPRLDDHLTSVSAALLTAADSCGPNTLLFDLSRVEGALRRFRAAMGEISPFYAVKAQPHPAVVSLLAAAGCGFDTASVAEIELVLSLGADPHAVVFGNTVKHPAAVARAVELGVSMFAFDSREELDKLSLLAPASLLYCRLANDGAGAAWPLSGKFGTDIDEAFELICLAASRGHRVGVSFHVGSQQSDPRSFARALGEVSALSARLTACGVTLELVDVGGGFPARYLDSVSAEFECFASSILSGLPAGPRVIAEPGRFLVADAGLLVTDVLAVTSRRSEPLRWAYLSAGVFSGLADGVGGAIHFPLYVAGADNDDVELFCVAGGTCDSADILYRSHPLAASVQSGDRVLVINAGAYSQTMATQHFNGFAPPSFKLV